MISGIENLELLEKVWNASIDGMAISDENGTVLKANNQYFNIYGYSENEIIGQNFAVIFPSELREFANEHYKQVFNSSEVTNNFETEIIRKDGEKRIVNSRIDFLLKDNKRFALLSVITDITEQKKAEDFIKDSEQKYKKAEKMAKLGHWELDILNNHLYWSDEIFRIFEISRSNFKATYESFLNFVHPDDREMLDEYYINSLIDNSNYEIIHRLLLPNGKIKYVKEKCEHQFDSNNNPIFSFGMVWDITDQIIAELKLKESEEKYKEIFDANADSIVIVGIDVNGGISNILETNESTTKLLGYSKVEFLNMSISDFEVDFNFDVAKSRIEEIHYKGFTNFETIVQNKFGNHFFVETKVIAINYNGQPALMNIIRNITERKANENKIKEQNEELKILNATKDKFFSIIAHDLRNPFVSLLSTSELLYKNYEALNSNDVREHIQTIFDSSKSTYKLLDNLLQWARSQMGSISFEPEELDFYELAFNSIYTLQNQANSKNIKLINEINPETYIYCDRNMMSSVLRNLVSNSIKFSNEFGTVTISCNNYEIDDSFILVIVKDTGIGISFEKQKLLFSIKEKISTQGTNRESGTGLGLIICKDFVEKHGGKIWVNSEIGQGSEFKFTIPKR